MGNTSSYVEVIYTPTDDMKADIFTIVFTSTAKFTHVLNNISVFKQEQLCNNYNSTRLNTKTAVAFGCVPVLMPKPLGYNTTYPNVKQPPPPVRNLSLPVPQRQVRLAAFYITPPPA